MPPELQSFPYFLYNVDELNFSWEKSAFHF